jgi:hypothetical protein
MGNFTDPLLSTLLSLLDPTEVQLPQILAVALCQTQTRLDWIDFIIFYQQS